MSVDCPRCHDLQQVALTASKAYHQLAEDLEAAHIRHNLEVLMLLSAGLEGALRSRDSAIAELVDHESACGRKKPAGVLPFSKRQSA